MLDTLLGMLAWFSDCSDPLAWLVVGTFTAGGLLNWWTHDRDRNRRQLTLAVWGLFALFWLALVYHYGVAQANLVQALVTAGGVPISLGLAFALTGVTSGERDSQRVFTSAAWILFALFWFTLIYHFAFEQKSIVEGIGTLVGVPGSLYVAYLLADGRDSLYTLSRAIAVMGLVFLPFETLVVFQQPLVETVTRQTEFLMGLLGYHPTVIHATDLTGPQRAASIQYQSYRNTFVFFPDPDHRITYTILIACTGIGSMAIFAGLVGAVRAPFRRKFRAFAISIPIIYALNLLRNVFIGLSFGHQLLDVFPNVVMTIFATSDPYMVSYYVADRIMSQVISVIALVAITWLVVQELPEVLVIVEDVLYLVTGSEYDLRDTLGIQPPVRADGDGECDPE